MILGIGCDIIEIARVKKACEKEGFLRKYYSEKERALIKEKGMSTAAGNFCAKEALVKALGTGFFPVMPVDIEVLRDSKGKPYINLFACAKDLADYLGVNTILVSISHSKEYAVAYVVLT